MGAFVVVVTTLKCSFYKEWKTVGTRTESAWRRQVAKGLLPSLTVVMLVINLPF